MGGLAYCLEQNQPSAMQKGRHSPKFLSSALLVHLHSQHATSFSMTNLSGLPTEILCKIIMHAVSARTLICGEREAIRGLRRGLRLRLVNSMCAQASRNCDCSNAVC